MVHKICLAEFELIKANSSDTKAPLLDLNLSISNGIVSTKINDERDNFDFDIVISRSWSLFSYYFYDRNHQMYNAVLLNRCYTQHTLHPFIDFESNHKIHFIKITFILQ